MRLEKEWVNGFHTLFPSVRLRCALCSLIHIIYGSQRRRRQQRQQHYIDGPYALTHSIGWFRSDRFYVCVRNHSFLVQTLRCHFTSTYTYNTHVQMIHLATGLIRSHQHKVLYYIRRQWAGNDDTRCAHAQKDTSNDSRPKRPTDEPAAPSDVFRHQQRQQSTTSTTHRRHADVFFAFDRHLTPTTPQFPD